MNQQALEAAAKAIAYNDNAGPVEAGHRRLANRSRKEAAHGYHHNSRGLEARRWIRGKV